jgi:hypothetical protein
MDSNLFTAHNSRGEAICTNGTARESSLMLLWYRLNGQPPKPVVVATSQQRSNDFFHMVTRAQLFLSRIDTSRILLVDRSGRVFSPDAKATVQSSKNGSLLLPLITQNLWHLVRRMGDGLMTF